MWKESTYVNNLAIDFTTRCNLRCSYCYLYSKQKGSKVEVSTEDLISTVEKSLTFFPNVTMIELWGGEPTIDPERLIVFSQHFKSRGISTWAPSTNGTLLHKFKYFDALNTCNFGRNFQVSFDGNRVFHNKYRDNSYDQVMASIKRMLYHDVRFSFRVTYPFDEFLASVIENLSAFPHLYRRFSQDPRVSSRVLDWVFGIREFRNKKLMCIYQEVDTIFFHDDIVKKSLKYRQYYEALSEVFLKAADSDIVFLPPYIRDCVEALLEKKEFVEPKNCGAFFSQVYLHVPTGNIFPCLSFDDPKYTKFGSLMNVHTGNINWGVVNTVRSFMYRRNRKCMLCILQPACFGGCFHTEPELVNTGRSFWDTSSITKCIFSHQIFDIVVDLSKKLIDRLSM